MQTTVCALFYCPISCFQADLLPHIMLSRWFIHTHTSLHKFYTHTHTQKFVYMLLSCLWWHKSSSQQTQTISLRLRQSDYKFSLELSELQCPLRQMCAHTFTEMNSNSLELLHWVGQVGDLFGDYIQSIVCFTTSVHITSKHNVLWKFIFLSHLFFQWSSIFVQLLCQVSWGPEKLNNLCKVICLGSARLTIKN